MFKAERLYLKARELSKDADFKPRSLFMVAKCSQKQVPVPGYKTFPDYDLYEKASAQYAKDIRKNKYFAEFVKKYNKTSFYKKAFIGCIYLKDDIKGK